MWPPSWILKQKKVGEIKQFLPTGWSIGDRPFLTHPLPAHFYRNQTWRFGKLSPVYNANLRSLIRRLYCRLQNLTTNLHLRWLNTKRERERERERKGVKTDKHPIHAYMSYLVSQKTGLNQTGSQALLIRYLKAMKDWG